MRYETINGTTHIYVEKGETDQEVLRAIVKASFELARPAGLGWIHFNDEQGMTDEMADEFVDLSRDVVVSMDYVQGRQCKTVIFKEKKDHFTLNNNCFERDRGLPDTMLDRAKALLTGEETAAPTSENMYKGENLTLRLKEYGYSRNQGESDWDFRKRVFPDLYQQDPDRALEFLMGSSAADWNDMEKILVLALASKGVPSHQELVKFAEGFTADPLEMWKK